jgi:hypothetical protein
VKEITAPEGYTLDPVYHFVALGASLTIQVENDPIIPPPEIEVLAFTGFNAIYYVIGFALMLIGALGSLILARNIRRRTNQ